jgi:hypothetical protein
MSAAEQAAVAAEGALLLPELGREYGRGVGDTLTEEGRTYRT